MKHLKRAIVEFKVLLITTLLLAFASTSATAGDIPLPQELNARASVLKAEKDGFWEKSLIVEFPERRRILSTGEGIVEVMAVVNHSAHPLLWKKVSEEKKTDHGCGGKIYLREIKERLAERLSIKGKDIAQMGTAADMDNLAVVTKTYDPFTVSALVTAGAKTNAIRTGLDEGTHIEGEGPAGTVNIIILTDARLTDGAMARSIITATEAKTAALEDLEVPSSYTKGVQATGTGTDSVIVVSGTTEPIVTYTGGHSRIGELMGKATYEAVVSALGKQNGFRRGTRSRSETEVGSAGTKKPGIPGGGYRKGEQ